MDPVLQMLIDMEKITLKDVEDVKDKVLDEYRLRMIEDIHSFCCREDHDTECEWYREITWNLPSHDKWTAEIIALKTDFSLNWDDVYHISHAVGSIGSGKILAAISKLLTKHKVI